MSSLKIKRNGVWEEIFDANLYYTYNEINDILSNYMEYNNLVRNIYIQNEQPLDTTSGSLWIDLDEEFVDTNHTHDEYAPINHTHNNVTVARAGFMSADDKIKLDSINANELAPAYDYGTTDLTAGSSFLETGKLYFVYE